MMSRKIKEITARIENAEIQRNKADLNLKAAKIELRKLLDNNENEQDDITISDTDLKEGRKKPSMSLRRWIVELLADGEMHTEQLKDELEQAHGYTSTGLGQVLINMYRERLINRRKDFSSRLGKTVYFYKNIEEKSEENEEVV